MSLGAGIRLSLTTLTVLPVRGGRVDRPAAAVAMSVAPAVGALLGLALAGILWLLREAQAPPLVAAAVTVAAAALLTRGMHLDGLADTVDGLASGWDRDRALAIMRRGNTGPLGAAALVIILGLQAASIGRIAVDLRSAILLGVVICCSRCALSLVCRRDVPAARSQGLGVAVAGSVPWFAAFLAWLAVAIVVGLGQAWVGGSYASGVIAAAVAGLAVLLLVWRCVRRLGGVTGDVMGAAIEIALTIMLVGIAG